MLKNFCWVLLLPLVAVFAANAESASKIAPEVSPVEEITITGGRTLKRVEYEIKAQEVAAYNLFNKLNDQDELDILCDYVMPTGYRIRIWKCEPKFIGNTKTRDFREAHEDVAGGTGMPARSEDSLKTYHQIEFGLLDQQIRTLAGQNPELAREFIRLQALKQEYDKINQEVRKDSFLGLLDSHVGEDKNK